MVPKTNFSFSNHGPEAETPHWYHRTSHTPSRSCPSLSFSSPYPPLSPGLPPPPTCWWSGGGGGPGEGGRDGDEKLRLGQDLD